MKADKDIRDFKALEIKYPACRGFVLLRLISIRTESHAKRFPLTRGLIIRETERNTRLLQMFEESLQQK